MKYDVFISYSSKNSAAVQAICHQLEDNNIKCWMAPRDIPVGAKYASVITQAIKECKAVVLVFSEYSAISPWVESEINIAFSNRKPIVPYKIDTTPLENYDEFYLMLNNRHWIEAYPDFKTRFADLVTVISNLVGAKTSNVTKPTPTPAKTYKVGDYYNDGVREGVVFEVSEDGKHGKIISVVEGIAKWSISNDVAYTTYTDYGLKNAIKIKSISNWRDKYPAFAWCADLGEGWYLPATDELYAIYNRRTEINDTLKARGMDILGAKAAWLWSSSEINAVGAYEFKMSGGNSGSNGKISLNGVRAVYMFGLPSVAMSEEPKLTAAPYTVGDYYNDGMREGVVFEVSANGRHGKIVSMKKSAGELQWSSDSAEQKRLIGADSEIDGAANMAKVMAISGWRDKYPAFKWCADLGEGWYLPSIEELLTIYKNKDSLNLNLTGKLCNYWSSTENNCQWITGEFCACHVSMGYGGTYRNSKRDLYYVRAVAVF